MSTVWFFAAKQGRIAVERLHYRKAKQLLHDRKALEKLVAKGHWLDAGYILVDLDEGRVVNGQEAFAAEGLK